MIRTCEKSFERNKNTTKSAQNETKEYNTAGPVKNYNIIHKVNDKSNIYYKTKIVN